MGRQNGPIVFVNYGGPKLNERQRFVVRSRAMAVVRRQQREDESCNETLAPLPSRLLEGPERLTSTVTERHRKTETTVNKHAGEIFCSQSKGGSPVLFPRPQNLSSSGYHTSGVHARMFEDYLSRCESYSAYLDEAFVLVGFFKPNFFRPDMTKPACVYIGWLITSGVLDAFRGTSEISYPHYEWYAVRALQDLLDKAATRNLHEVVYPVVILGLFEMVRFGPHTTTHLAAVERFIKTRGGLTKMPPALQGIVIMADLLQCVCLDSKLAFSTLDDPVFTLQTANYEGDHILSSPLLCCNDEDFSMTSRFLGFDTAARLAPLMESTSRAIGLLCEDQDLRDMLECIDTTIISIGELADGAVHDISRLVAQTCAIACRITIVTIIQRDGFGNSANQMDMQFLYDNLRFLRPASWAGLPYLYLWVNLVGLASSTNRERSYFAAEIMRITFSFGCYQADVLTNLLKNFTILRRAVSNSVNEPNL